MYRGKWRGYTVAIKKVFQVVNEDSMKKLRRSRSNQIAPEEGNQPPSSEKTERKKSLDSINIKGYVPKRVPTKMMTSVYLENMEKVRGKEGRCVPRLTVEV